MLSAVFSAVEAEELRNLDLDPRDAKRLQPFQKHREDFDDKNWASVRRTLADAWNLHFWREIKEGIFCILVYTCFLLLHISYDMFQ